MITSSVQKPFRIAIIGLGNVTRNIHIPAYKSLGIEIVAGCDNDRAAREIMKNDFGVRDVFDDPLEMVKKTAPDIVSICTPPAFHLEQCLMVTENGCHVFCEKPLVEELSEADQLIEAAANSKRHIVVNNQFPYMNIHRAAKNMIGTPEFGRLLFLQANQVFHRDEITEADWRGRLRRRLCFEFGIHVFSLVRYFFEEEPISVSAHMPNPIRGSRSDVLNLITLEFNDGLAASIILNRVSSAPERYLDMRLDGEHSSISTSIGGEVRFEAGIHTRKRRPFLAFSFVKGGKAVLQNGTDSRIISKDDINPFATSTARHFKQFISAIAAGNVPEGNVADNRKTLALVFASYDAAEAGKTVKMSEYLA